MVKGIEYLLPTEKGEIKCFLISEYDMKVINDFFPEDEGSLVPNSVVLEISSMYDNAYSLPNTKRAVKKAVESGLVTKKEIRDFALKELAG